MSVFESINESATSAIKSSENYIKSTEKYIRLKIFQQLSLSFSTLIKVAIIGSFAFFGFIFLAIAGAIALGNQLNNMPLGILIVGLILLIIALIAFGLRKFIDKIILRKISKSFFD